MPDGCTGPCTVETVNNIRLQTIDQFPGLYTDEQAQEIRGRVMVASQVLEWIREDFECPGMQTTSSDESPTCPLSNVWVNALGRINKHDNATNTLNYKGIVDDNSDDNRSPGQYL